MDTEAKLVAAGLALQTAAAYFPTTWRYRQRDHGARGV